MIQSTLSEIIALNAGIVRRENGGSIVVVTDPQQWTYAAQLSLDSQPLDKSILVTISLLVEEGIFGFGLLRPDGLDWIARNSAIPTDEPVERHLAIPAGECSDKLVFEKWSADAAPARAIIFAIHVRVVDPDELCRLARDAEEQGNREDAAAWYRTVLAVDRHCVEAIAGVARLGAQGVVSLIEDMWPLAEPQFATKNMQSWSKEKLKSQMTGDTLRDNLILNKWEFANGVIKLKSYPWRLSVPFTMCNAQCEFCAAWSVKGNVKLDDLMESLVPVIRRCYNIDMVGWGEPLIHPQFAEILNIIEQEADPRARISLTTNGTRLEEWIDRLLVANVMWYSVSIHAATAETHQDLMGLGPDQFDRVLAAVRRLITKKNDHPGLNVELVMVVTQQNIAEIPAFVQMAEKLGADTVFFKTLMPQDAPREELDYHRLPPYRHPQFEQLRAAAITAMSRTRLAVKGDPISWATPLFLPEWEAKLDTLPLTPRHRRKYHRFEPPADWDALPSGQAIGTPSQADTGVNLYDRHAPLYCPSPYTAFYVNGTYRKVIPCVYMHEVPGHEFNHFKPSMRFEDVWNAPSMIAVRRALNEGPLMPECMKCPFHCG